MEREILKNCHTVWENCMAIIRSHIPEQSFMTWFKPVRAVRLQDDVLTLELPTTFYYEWIEEHFLPVLKIAIEHEIGPNAKLEYEVVVDKGSGDNEPFTLKFRNNHLGKAKSQAAVAAAHAPASAPVQALIGPPPAHSPQPVQQEPSLNWNPFAIPLAAQNLRDSNLNAGRTFETYVEGECNRLGKNAGLEVAQRPGTTAFNPLVIHSEVGLGKTHLAQAIGNEIKANNPGKFVLYVSSEQFTAQFIEALRTNTIQNFLNYYLQVDVLIMDDVQFLSGKDKTQENFFHIFNRLHQSGKQIVLTIDRPPSSLQGMQERLLSRFKWGLTIPLNKPDMATRIQIVKLKTEAEGVYFPENIVEFLAANIESNIRELEGVIVSLIGYASLMKKDVDMELARSVLKNIVKNNKTEVSLESIQQCVADYFKVSMADVLSKSRKREIANARQISMYLAQKHTDLPLKSIGQAFGGKDHSTVIHATKAVAKKLKEDHMVQKAIFDIMDMLHLTA